MVSGAERGAPRDMTLMAAAAALFVAEKVETLAEGVGVAAEAIDTGKAHQLLTRWVAASHG